MIDLTNRSINNKLMFTITDLKEYFMKKKILLLALATIMLTSCQSAPTTVTNDGITHAQSEFESIVEAYESDDEEDDNTTKQDIVKNYLSDDGLRVDDYYFEKDGKSISINADVVDYNYDEINQYTMTMIGNQELKSRMVDAYYGDTDVEITHTDAYTVRYDTPKMEKVDFNQDFILFSQSIKNFYPFEDGQYYYIEDVNCIYNEDEAKILCEEFLDELECDDYVFRYTLGFGKGGHSPYYHIVYSKKIDDLTVVSNQFYTRIVFLVDNDGVSSVSFSDYEVKNAVNVDILDLNLAIYSLESKIDLLNSKAYTESFDSLVDENLNIIEYNIGKIELVYSPVSYSTNRYVLVPMWRFLLEDKNGELNYDSILLINALDGELRTEVSIII